MVVLALTVHMVLGLRAGAAFVTQDVRDATLVRLALMAARHAATIGERAEASDPDVDAEFTTVASAAATADWRFAWTTLPITSALVGTQLSRLRADLISLPPPAV
jgi:hypothetical protein